MFCVCGCTGPAGDDGGEQWRVNTRVDDTNHKGKPMDKDREQLWYTQLGEVLMAVPSPLPSGLLQYLAQGPLPCVVAAANALKWRSDLTGPDRVTLATVVLDTPHDVHEHPEVLAEYLVQAVTEGRDPQTVWDESRVQQYLEKAHRVGSHHRLRSDPSQPAVRAAAGRHRVQYGLGRSGSCGPDRMGSGPAACSAVPPVGADDGGQCSGRLHVHRPAGDLEVGGPAPQERGEQDLWAGVRSELFMVLALHLGNTAPAEASVAAMRRVLPAWFGELAQGFSRDIRHWGDVEQLVRGTVSVWPDDLLTSVEQLVTQVPVGAPEEVARIGKCITQCLRSRAAQVNSGR